MNFEIKKEVFLHYLFQIQKILPQKTFFPIYYSIKLETLENFLFLEVSNMNINAKIKIRDESLKVEKKGCLVVSGKYFIDIIKKIEHYFIKIFLIENNFLIIQTHTSEYKLKLIDLDNFPSVNFNFDFKNSFEIKGDLFLKTIKESNITTSKDKQKIILTGVNFIYKKPFLTVLATDSFRLSKKKIRLELEYFDFNIIIPSKSLEHLSKLLEQQKTEIFKIFISEQKFFLYTDSLSFQTSLLEGNYPQLPKIKKENFPYFLKFKRENLIKVLERVSLFFPKEGNFLNHVVDFKLKKNQKIEIFANSEEIGNVLEEIEISSSLIENKADFIFNTKFNIKYLEEILRIFSTKEIIFSFENFLKPFIIYSDEDSNLIYLILPFL